MTAQILLPPEEAGRAGLALDLSRLRAGPSVVFGPSRYRYVIARDPDQRTCQTARTILLEDVGPLLNARDRARLRASLEPWQDSDYGLSPPKPAGVIDLEAIAPHLDEGRLRILSVIAEASERPALAVQDGQYHLSRPWLALKRHKRNIQRAIRSVARVENKLPQDAPIGTAFVVGPGLMLTNRHVAINIRAGATVDFNEERSSTSPPREHAILDVLPAPQGIAGQLDVALLRVALRDQNGAAIPAALEMGDIRRLRRGKFVCLIGYPLRASEANQQAISDLMLAFQYGIKRLQPGKILKVRKLEFAHDCSTSLGNSGSCIIDPVTGAVLGINYAGSFSLLRYDLRENRAVSLGHIASALGIV